MGRVRIIGSGRAGVAFSQALTGAGWEVAGLMGRADDPAGAAAGVDLLLLATPDSTIESVSAAVEPVPTTVVAHVAGALGLEVLQAHVRRAAVHPLMTLPAGERGAANLSAGGWFAVAGDPLVQRVVADLGGRWFTVPDERRVLYHAIASIAANHLVALMGQVERLAGEAEVPFESYLALAQAALADVASLGPARALTGPAARGDSATLAAHVAALPDADRESYRALSALATGLASRP